MLPELAIGLMLAGIFAATMSTADSQILSCSAAITQDLFPRARRSYRASKIATLAVAAFALTIALTASQGVFELVLVAWAALAATLGPILLLRLARAPLSPPLALIMMAIGLAVVFIWGAIPILADSVYKVLPGMIAPLLFYALVRAGSHRRGGRPRA